MTDRSGESKQMAEEKKMIRKRMLALRDSCSKTERARWDKKIEEIAVGMDEYQRADAILAYVGFRSEVGTLSLIRRAWNDGKSVFAPKVSGEEMEFFKIDSEKDLQAGFHGIMEPDTGVSFPEWIEERSRGSAELRVMMWMPGAAFDTKGHRIGYGGGFYDKYAARLERLLHQPPTKEHGSCMDGVSLTLAALAYSCQVLPDIPCEEYDAVPHVIITENGILEHDRKEKDIWNI